MFAKVEKLERVQRFAVPLDVCWEFFSNPLNLAKITPPKLGFKPHDTQFDRIRAGMILTYTVSPLLSVPLTWTTEITHVEAPHYFVDEQRFGPYLFWHHQHFFKQEPGGVAVTDLVHYAVPYGFIGRLLFGRKVRRELEGIFNYRQQVLPGLLGG